MPKQIDLTGQVFGNLTVESFAGSNSDRHSLWWCHCAACGQRKQMRTANLRRGNTVSCGCQQRALIAVATTKHGMSKTRHYTRWKNMVWRCTKPTAKSYEIYGGRGIKVCPRWQFGEDDKTGFECFMIDMGLPPFEGATIDRINTKGDYEPGNVRWANATQQARNMSSNVVNAEQVSEIKARLERRENSSEICQAFGISRGQLSHIRTGQTWADVLPAGSNISQNNDSKRSNS